MTPETSERVYVWVWLPDASAPIPCGVLVPGDGGLWFAYGQSYLDREDAVSLWHTLPLERRWLAPTGGLGMPGAMRDAHPDAWGMRVVEYGVGRTGQELPAQTYLLHSDSNRFGAIDFQTSPERYVARGSAASLDDDNHLRNHAAFWDGRQATLTPAFDLSPQRRSGDARAIALAYDNDGNREASWAGLLAAHGIYHFSRQQAAAELRSLRQALTDNLDDALDFGHVTTANHAALKGHQFLNPATFYGTNL